MLRRISVLSHGMFPFWTLLLWVSFSDHSLFKVSRLGFKVLGVRSEIVCRCCFCWCQFRQPPIQELSSPDQLNGSLSQYYKFVVKADVDMASLVRDWVVGSTSATLAWLMLLRWRKKLQVVKGSLSRLASPALFFAVENRLLVPFGRIFPVARLGYEYVTFLRILLR